MAELLYEDESYKIRGACFNDRIVIEVKSKPTLTKEDEKQFWGYLKGSKYKLGFLVNFSPQQLIIKRYVHTKKLSA